MEAMMDNDWGKHILKLRYHPTESEAREYVTLVDQALGNCTSEVADVLFKTFTNEEDFGVQESVVSALGTAEPEVYVEALLKALPMLIYDAPKWADVLVGREVHFAPVLLASVANRMGMDSRKALVSLITQPDFREFYSNSLEVASCVDLQDPDISQG
jgi:hypothetical protein